MSDTRPFHEPSTEARWLRDNWDAKNLGSHEGNWVAVKGDGVVDADPSIARLMERTRGFDPLYALVMLGKLQ